MNMIHADSQTKQNRQYRKVQRKKQQVPSAPLSKATSRDGIFRFCSLLRSQCPDRPGTEQGLHTACCAALALSAFHL